MLRKIRTTAAIIFWFLITAMLLDFTGTLHHWLGWTAKVQFLPALLAMNAVVVIALIVLTLLLGRVYCSVICPLGVFQDIASNLSARRNGKKRRFKYTAPLVALRFGVLAAFIIALVAGFTAIASLIAPYSAYARMTVTIGQPAAIWINNLLASVTEHYDSYAIYGREVWLRSGVTLAVAVVTFLLIGLLAWRNGRIWCNSICPVGTILGFLSRWSYLRPVIDTTKCIDCGACARGCKSSCIDVKNHRIDLSRCVVCMDCIDNCSQGAISYTTKGGRTISREEGNGNTTEPDMARRSFMLIGASAVGTAILHGAGKTVDGGVAEILDKENPERTTRLVPPGAVGTKHFAQHCTACQLCVSECPNQVLRPSLRIENFMQPEMQYDRGYCRPECNACAEVCPAGAIRPIPWEEKSSIQIGHAVWSAKNCVVLTDDVDCGNCGRHCPTGAIIMVPSDPSNPESRKIPAVDETRCIGCGACENLCPARPFSAIHVEGHEMHRVI